MMSVVPPRYIRAPSAPGAMDILRICRLRHGCQNGAADYLAEKLSSVGLIVALPFDADAAEQPLTAP